MSQNHETKVEYLSRCGLIEILKHPTNCKTHTLVWLYRDDDGAWTYTHSRAIAKSNASGVSVPAHCLNQGKLFAPAEEAILKFLKDLGLSDAETSLVYAKCPK